MNKLIFLTVLFTSAVWQGLAQTNRTAPATKPLYTDIQLGAGNRLLAKFADAADVRTFKIDSALQVMITDMMLISDSTSDQLSGKKFSYRFGASGHNFLSVTKTAAPAATYYFSNGAAAAVKTVQDTVEISGNAGTAHEYLLQFLLDSYTEITQYTPGHLQDSLLKVTTSEITASNGNDPRRDGVPSDSRSTTFSGQYGIGAAVQNYKDAFVPSLTAKIELRTHRNGILTGYGIFSEALFSFEKTGTGNRITHINNFAGVSFSRSRIASAQNPSTTTPLYFSLAYLIRQNGNLFDKHNFRFGAGRLNLFKGGAVLDPFVYFRDFLKNASPGLRFTVYF